MDLVTSHIRIGDAFGEALRDRQAGGSGNHSEERDDGYLATGNAAPYFDGPEDWSELDVVAVERVAGRVLDLGAGAGRCSLVLQDRGHAPVALDTSAGAIEVCRERGVRETFHGTVEELAAEQPPPFDAVILMGNNLALLGSAEQSGIVLDAMRAVLRPDGQVVGTCLDPYLTDDPDNLAYHELNRAAGRMAGRIGLRVRRHLLATAWFDYLFMSPAELGELAERAGWRLTEMTEPDPVYLAVLRPE